jgi:predicted kinase
MTPNQNLDRGTNGERIIRLVRPSVVVLCGPAACGKSTFAARHFRPTQVISSDHCRALVCDDEQDQRFQAQAFALLHFIVEQRLSLNRLCVVDSTALAPHARRTLIGLVRRHRVPCVLLGFEIPLPTCVIRDQARGQQPQGRAVGRAAIERQYHMFDEAKSALAQEGFDQIEMIREEELDKVRFEILFRPAPRLAPAPRAAAPQFQQRSSVRENPASPEPRQPEAVSRPSAATVAEAGARDAGRAASGPPASTHPAAASEAARAASAPGIGAHPRQTMPAPPAAQPASEPPTKAR